MNCGYLETKPEASKSVTAELSNNEVEDMDDDLDELESSFLVESLVQRAMKADLAPVSGNQQKLVTSATRCPVDDPIVMTEMILLKVRMWIVCSLYFSNSFHFDGRKWQQWRKIWKEKAICCNVGS